MESTPLLASSSSTAPPSSSSSGLDGGSHRRTNSNSYYFLNKQQDTYQGIGTTGSVRDNDGGNVVEELPAGAVEEEFAPRPLGPRVRFSTDRAVARVVRASERSASERFILTRPNTHTPSFFTSVRLALLAFVIEFLLKYIPSETIDSTAGDWSSRQWIRWRWYFRRRCGRRRRRLGVVALVWIWWQCWTFVGISTSVR